MAFVSNVMIQPSAGEPNRLFLSRRLYETWHLISFPYLILKCGTEKQLVNCVPGSRDDETKLTCDPRLLQQFHLPAEPIPLKLAFDPHTEELEIGPIIAVLTLIKKGTFDGALVPYCEELGRYSEKHHSLFYVFTLRDWRRESVVGYLRRHNQWDRHELPQPQAIHNRIGQRRLERLPATERFFESLAEKQIAIFNARYLDKWEIHEKLSSRAEFTPYLPETILHENKRSLNEMLKRHPSVFLKPAAGSQGKRIFRVHQKENRFELDYTTFSGGIERRYTKFDPLYLNIESRLRRQRYIIQQGLSLMEYGGRPLDFRILCNKGYTGKWKITSGVARVSSEEQFVSNLARGGASYSIREVLEDSFHEKAAKQIQQLLGELALEACEILSMETEGIYGELGVDLALDSQGKPWIIEVNTKPSKDLDPEREQTVIRPSAKAVIDYACFLAGFAKN